MKTYPRLIQKLFCEPLLVLPSTFSTFERALLQRLGLPFDGEIRDPHIGRKTTRVRIGDKEVEETTEEAVRAETPAARTQRRINNVLTIYGSVAVISIDGVIDKRISDYELDCYGGVDLADVDAAIAQVAANPLIARVVFDFNTPGGSAAGVPETAARIRRLGDFKNNGGAAKETRARVELLCCSAGQWLAAQCDSTDAAPSATLGSIGVYCALLDQTKWMDNEGLKVNLIKAGKFKAMGASFKALEDDERALLQTRIDGMWSHFKATVREGRGDVAESTMQGQSFKADEAKQLNLVDAITSESLDEYVSRLMTS